MIAELAEVSTPIAIVAAVAVSLWALLKFFHGWREARLVWFYQRRTEALSTVLEQVFCVANASTYLTLGRELERLFELEHHVWLHGNGAVIHHFFEFTATAQMCIEQMPEASAKEMLISNKQWDERGELGELGVAIRLQLTQFWEILDESAAMAPIVDAIRRGSTTRS